MDFILHISSICGQGGGGPKIIGKFCGHHIWKLPKRTGPMRDISYLWGDSLDCPKSCMRH